MKMIGKMLGIDEASLAAGPHGSNVPEKPNKKKGIAFEVDFDDPAVLE